MNMNLRRPRTDWGTFDNYAKAKEFLESRDYVNTSTHDTLQVWDTEGCQATVFADIRAREEFDKQPVKVMFIKTEDY